MSILYQCRNCDLEVAVSGDTIVATSVSTWQLGNKFRQNNTGGECPECGHSMYVKEEEHEEIL